MDNVKSLSDVLYEAKQQLFFDGDLSESEEEEFIWKTPQQFDDPVILSLIVNFVGLDARRVCKKWNQSWWDHLSLDDKVYYNILIKEQKHLYTLNRFSIPAKMYIKFIGTLTRRELLRYLTKPYLFNRIAIPYSCPSCNAWMTQVTSYDQHDYNRIPYNDERETVSFRMRIISQVIMHREKNNLIVMSFKKSADCFRNVSYCRKTNDDTENFFKIQDHNRL